MSPRSHRLQATVAGMGVVLVDIWPVLLIWRAGASGSVGDLSEVSMLWLGVVAALGVGALAAWLMYRALGRAARSPRLVPGDVWGAYALAVGVYTLALTLTSGLQYLLLLTDENQSLRSRFGLVAALWVGGHAAAVLVSIGAAAALLGRDQRPAQNPVEQGFGP